MPSESDEPLDDIVNRERSRLRSFIRRRVRDPRDAEDILQDVFSALVEANRLLMPIDQDGCSASPATGSPICFVRGHPSDSSSKICSRHRTAGRRLNMRAPS